MSDRDDSEYRKARKELHDCVNELRKIEGKKPIPWIENEPPYCSFCGKGKNEVQRTIVSTAVAICNICIEMSVDILESRMSEEKGGRKEENVKSMFCSFCGKSSSEVQQIIQGPSVFICDECVMKNSEILG